LTRPGPPLERNLVDVDGCVSFVRGCTHAESANPMPNHATSTRHQSARLRGEPAPVVSSTVSPVGAKVDYQNTTTWPIWIGKPYEEIA